MCGILCALWHNSHEDDKNITDYTNCKCVIKQRGPDCFAEKEVQLPYSWRAFFAASVLWMQGPKPVKQPCIDSDGNILLWNGDIFSGSLVRNDVSDTETLLVALRDSKNITDTLKSIRGPYSIIYYQAKQRLLHFARDPIGRHSLLMKINKNAKGMTLSSSASTHLEGATEVPAVGVFVFNLETSIIGLHPWRSSELRCANVVQDLKTRFDVDLLIFNELYKEEQEPKKCEADARSIEYFDNILLTVEMDQSCNINSTTKNSSTIKPENVMKSLLAKPGQREKTKRVLELLKESIEVRVKKKPEYCKNCIKTMLQGEKSLCNHSKIGVLFSGGLDSTILAALADEFVPKNESIDLINVAFEKTKRNPPQPSKKGSQKLDDVTVNFDVPDRKTGREALGELKEICPWRTWNFVECNITKEELQKFRSTRIRDLVYPLETILDDSLGCALWFASRGAGVLSSTEESYNSPCRVLLLGMGADELFGGYTRHRTTLRRGGWTALNNELHAELERIAERNLGRDDRVVADHGRQSRLPYLDENFVEYVRSLEASERCCPTETMPAGLGDKLLLRLVAHEVGLCRTATFPKRAFQFGSRIANSRDNAKDTSKWL